MTVDERIRMVDAEVNFLRLRLAALGLERAMLVVMKRFRMFGQLVVAPKKRSVVEEAERIVRGKDS